MSWYGVLIGKIGSLKTSKRKLKRKEKLVILSEKYIFQKIHSFSKISRTLTHPKDSCEKKICFFFIDQTLKFLPTTLLEEFWDICSKRTWYYNLMNFILCPQEGNLKNKLKNKYICLLFYSQDELCGLVRFYTFNRSILELLGWGEVVS